MFIIEGVIGIFEQQMTSMNNLLPGAKKSAPYVADTGTISSVKFLFSLDMWLIFDCVVIFMWKMVELNKVRMGMF